MLPDLETKTEAAAARVGRITLNLYETSYTAQNGKRFHQYSAGSAAGRKYKINFTRRVKFQHLLGLHPSPLVAPPSTFAKLGSILWKTG
jgi:hypothetical protein